MAGLVGEQLEFEFLRLAKRNEELQREGYKKLIEWTYDTRSYSVFNALKEDGFDLTVDYVKLLAKFKKEK